MQQKNDQIRYTYADYEKWDDGNRWELVDGAPYLMSPAPTPVHQEISINLAAVIHQYLRGKTCKVYTAPFDVRLDADSTNDTVVQPDIVVVCDPSQIDEKGCKGAPDLIVEILSPSSMKLDQETKFKKYLESGVKEYWIINPDTRNLFVHLLKEGEYTTRVYNDAEQAPVHILESCIVSLSDVFPRASPVEEESIQPPSKVKHDKA